MRLSVYAPIIVLLALTVVGAVTYPPLVALIPLFNILTFGGLLAIVLLRRREGTPPGEVALCAWLSSIAAALPTAIALQAMIEDRLAYPDAVHDPQYGQGVGLLFGFALLAGLLLGGVGWGAGVIISAFIRRRSKIRDP